MTYWKDWLGGGDDLLLATAYDKGTDDAIIVGLDPSRNDKGATVGVVSLDLAHAGGIAMHSAGRPGAEGDWLYVSEGAHTIHTFKVSKLQKAMKVSRDSDLQKTPKIKPVEITKDLYGTSFLAVDSSQNKLYAGMFNKNHRDWMYRYNISDNDGSFSLDRRENGKPWRWEVPGKTQGVTMTGKRFIFSSSGGLGNTEGRLLRSNLYVTDRLETNLDKAGVRCFRAPSMSEGLATDGRNAYVLYESGSWEYNGHKGKRARNVIEGVHTAKLSRLTGLSGGTLRLGTLHSKEQEDFFGEDEIAIVVEGQKLGETIDIEQGQRKPIKTTVQFTGNARIRLYEKDTPDSDDYLGQRKLKPRTDKGILSFTAGGPLPTQLLGALTTSPNVGACVLAR